MSGQFFVRRGEREQGPFTPEQIQQLAATGMLVASDLVRTADKPDWCRAGSFSELFASDQPSAGSSSEYDIEGMLDEWLELYEDNPDSVPSPQSIWPGCPPEVLDEIRGRLRPILDANGFFLPSNNGDDAKMAIPDLSVLKEGYRPTTSSYLLTEPLGEGGCGAVWKAENPKTGKTVAFKFSILMREHDPLENEFSKIKELDHPGIVRLQEEHPHAPIPCLQYEFIDGMDLGKFLVKYFKFLDPESVGGDRCPINPNHAAAVILKLAEIMAYVHDRPKIVHRDLKPANILVSNHLDMAVLSALGIEQDLRLATLKVMDFGLAGRFRPDGRNSADSKSIGENFAGWRTAAYASPQQRLGHPGHPADDVYAIGVMWYELLRGRIGSGPTGLMRLCDELRTKRMPEAQLKVLADCLEEERDDRIQDAVDLVRRIRAAYTLDEPVSLFQRVNDANRRGLRFEKVTSLSVEMAQLLAKGGVGELSGLRSLPASIAETLASITGIPELWLDGLESLTDEAAHALARFRGDSLNLAGLTTLTPKAVECLAKGNANLLNLSGFTTVSLEVAQALAKFEGKELVLNGLTILEPEVARAIAKWEGERLSLGGLKSLAPKAALALTNWEGKCLFLDGLESLASESAKSLAEWQGKELFLDGLIILTPEVSQALARWKGSRLSLNGLKTLTQEAAECLVRWTGWDLSLNGLITRDELTLSLDILLDIEIDDTRTFTPATAEALAKWKGSSVSLNGLKMLTPEIAQSLAKWKNGEHLCLNGLTKLSRKAAKAVCSWKGGQLELDGLTTLSGDVAEALAEWEGGSLSLCGLTNLTQEAADALSIWTGNSLYLKSLTMLTKEVAEALAKWKGDYLLLSGVTTLTSEVDQAFAKWKGTSLLFGDGI